ncbi:alpha/beta hydrolase [Actinomyces sp. 594]|nr:alpha/beta hydrolase [Actinomyces sp. 594]
MMLLNGCGLSAAGWDEVVAGLPGRRVITVDRPGHHGTRHAGPPSLAGEARFLVELLDAEPGQVVVVAHSMAAFQAEAIARLRPGRVAGVMLVDPSATPPHARASAAADALDRIATRCLRLAAVRVAAGRMLRAGMRSQTTRPEAIDSAGWRPLWGSERALGAAAAEWLAFREQAAQLLALRRRQAIPAPVPAVVLEAPPFSGAAAVTSLLTAFRASRIRRVPGSRHLMMLDEPRVIVEEIERLS